jgi:hypothetical protein
VQRLQRLAQLQARVRRSGFIDVTRDEIAPDGLNGGPDGSARQAVRIHRGAPDLAVDKAQTLLKLMVGGLLTEGAVGQGRAT